MGRGGIRAISSSVLLPSDMRTSQVHKVTLIYARNLFSLFPYPDPESRRTREEQRSPGSWAKPGNCTPVILFTAGTSWYAVIEKLKAIFTAQHVCSTVLARVKKIAPFRLLLCVCFWGQRKERTKESTRDNSN